LATLPSNDGEAQFVIELGAPVEYALETGYESAIHLRGRYWDGGEQTFPLSTSISGLWLSAPSLTSLRDHISQWLRQPLRHLIADDLSAGFELAQLYNQSVHVRFGRRDDTISDMKPVVTIAFLAGALQGEFHFVTDQSCLALFVEELSAEISSSHEIGG
jgi:hypothetical protein